MSTISTSPPSDTAAETLVRECRERGYASVDLAVAPPVLAGLMDDVDALWREALPCAAYSFHGHWTRFAGQDTSPLRRAPCRLADLHAVSQNARALYLWPEVHAALAELAGGPVVAMHSVYDEWAVPEALHRSASGWEVWIACEDVTAEGGALLVVPGSHRLPDAAAPADGLGAARPAWDTSPSILAGESWLAQCAAAGLAVEALLPRRGSALILHPDLLRGSRHRAGTRTRRAFAVRFEPRSAVSRVERTYIDPLASRLDGEREPAPRIYATAALLMEGERLGFDSPLHQHCLRESPVVYGRVAELADLLTERTAERDRLAGRISWMRRSRFWALREAWFGLKRRMGLTRED